VVGAGVIAAAKIRKLLNAGARLTVVAPEACEEIRKLVSEEVLEYLAQPFHDSLMDRPFRIIFAATDDPALNAELTRIAREQGCWINVADDGESSSLIVPAVIDRGSLVVALSSGGHAPALLSWLRYRLEAMIPQDYAVLTDLMAQIRPQVAKRWPDIRQRREFWQRFLSRIEPMATGGQSGKMRFAAREMIETVEQADYTGHVALVGAGPGDPDLLTLKAWHLLQQADVILYDNLVSDAILAKARPEAVRIRVGKKSGHHSWPQDAINRELIALARAGNRVVRLKGGDPFIFGRGGEEIATLMEHGIDFQIVPGITAASGCAAYAGIPLTHRELAHSCIFVTAHPHEKGSEINWSVLCQPRQTIAIYMGLGQGALISQRLLEHGLPAQHPVAIVEHGTSENQRVFTGRLDELPTMLADNRVQSPALLIVGEVVRMRSHLSWFDASSV